VGIGKGHREIGGGCRFRLWSQDNEFHRVARAGTSALAHGVVHTQPVASRRVGFLSLAKLLSGTNAFEISDIQEAETEVH